jgi:hypothetical protein
MRLFFATLTFVLLLGVIPNYDVTPAPEDLILENGCVIYALNYKKVLKAGYLLNEVDIWNKMIFLKTSKMTAGHAVLLFIHGNITYAFDPGRGTFTLAYYAIYDPWDIAELLYPGETIIFAKYAETALIYQMSGIPYF